MYSFSVAMQVPFDEAIDRVTEALASEGFGVLTDIDVAGTMKAKLSEDMDPYRILGACNPALAHQAVSVEPSIGALLPCNVVVRQAPDGVMVDFMDPAAAMGLAESPTITQIGTEVRRKLENVAHSLAPEVTT